MPTKQQVITLPKTNTDVIITILCLYCLLGTIQSYLSFIPILFEANKWAAIADLLFGELSFFKSGSATGYMSYFSWADIAFELIFWMLPLFLVLYFIRHRRTILLLLFVLFYSSVSWFLLNMSVFFDRVAAWSTYSPIEVVTYTWSYSGGWLVFAVLIFALILYPLLNSRCCVISRQLT